MNGTMSQELPKISPLTYEIMEEADDAEAAVLQDMMDNPQAWETLTNKESLKRMAMIYDQYQKGRD